MTLKNALDVIVGIAFLVGNVKLPKCRRIGKSKIAMLILRTGCAWNALRGIG
jgi:hypothetical protein